ncbi:hypothetical protein [Desulfuromonas sp. CSMB_57]|uniref:hypothetical protein n=1 Tax=Desulfuromonas sp. CSMB_57 TaxID=2807629 RepID=UPI001CD2F5D4|nr:hypothetical protein [Desulfuromonas sp. CSMB_57]
MKNIHILAIFIVLMVTTGFSGFLYGKKVSAKRYNDHFFDLFMSSIAINLKNDIEVINLINKNQNSNAVKRLEGSIDINLSSLSAYTEKEHRNPDLDILEAISFAQKYIDESSTYKTIPNIETSVKKTLDYVKKQKGINDKPPESINE